MLNKDLQHIIKLYKEGRYKINSENNMDVDGCNVQRQTKQGRTLLICDCKNDTKFCNESPICRHKKFFLNFPFLELISEKAREKLNFYKVAKSQPIDIEIIFSKIIDDLNNFKELDFR